MPMVLKFTYLLGLSVSNANSAAAIVRFIFTTQTQ